MLSRVSLGTRQAACLSRYANAQNSDQSAMIMGTPKRFYQLQRLHVYDKGGRNSLSGVSATVFGCTSPLGVYISNSLTRIGSPCVFPYRKTAGIWDNGVKELKQTADLGYKAPLKL